MHHRTWKYDVFLSFRGPDVRHTFIAHLHRALIRMGIGVFIDNINIPKGQYIAEAIPRAIAESRFSVVVLSKGYAPTPLPRGAWTSWLR
ncbi:unnamed protein product [Linum tenue]|uniref:ADP-ribosyl cyclase/cyclic ADP-ribose hydrolase n=2 Tax=Linum tenue TaxID=586396 RepID=A0AAV0R854_9ROSI|nr:unnamed protein product [Linum tenue]